MSVLLEAGGFPESLSNSQAGHQGMNWPGQATVVKQRPGRACKAPTKFIASPPHEDAQVTNSKLAGQKWGGVCPQCHLLWHPLGSAQDGTGWATAPRLHLFGVEEGLQRSQIGPSWREEGWRPRQIIHASVEHAPAFPSSPVTLGKACLLVDKPTPGLPPFLAENRDGSYLPAKAGIQLLLEAKHPWGLEGGTEMLALCGDEPARPMGKKNKMR